ncbi:MAG TPA: GNAT family N-acetyltransferase [Actinomadura sp.]|nr:GNAT family N-acetyltransferase [Actinomadura sp.]
MRQFEVRRLTEHEWQIWRDVRLAALRDAPDAFHSTLEREQAYDQARWRDMAKPAWGVKVVAFAGDSPVGVVGGYVCQEVEGAVDLFGMWVSPAARGSGVGAELVREVIAWANERDYAEMRLWVVDGNEHAQRLYVRLGFTATDEFSAHPRDRSARYQLMIRDLREPEMTFERSTG